MSTATTSAAVMVWEMFKEKKKLNYDARCYFYAFCPLCVSELKSLNNNTKSGGFATENNKFFFWEIWKDPTLNENQLKDWHWYNRNKTTKIRLTVWRQNVLYAFAWTQNTIEMKFSKYIIYKRGNGSKWANKTLKDTANMLGSYWSRGYSRGVLKVKAYKKWPRFTGKQCMCIVPTKQNLRGQKAKCVRFSSHIIECNDL